MGVSQVGGTSYSNLALDEVKAVVIAGPCLLFNIAAFNTGAVSYLQFFDALTANVTVGTTTPTFVLALPAAGGINSNYVLPKRFRNGVVIACTSAPTTNGAPAADAIITLDYTGG